MSGPTGAAGRTLAGSGRLLRFMLRRERLALPIWLAVIGALLGTQSRASQAVYDPAHLDQLRETLGGNPAVVALAGPPELIVTIGGEVAFEVFGYVLIVVALMNMFLVGRNSRADEETGRAELIRSTRVGRRAPLLAALTLACLSNVAAAGVLATVGVATGLPVWGSVVCGLAAAAAGLFFAALAGVAMQVFDHSRAAYGAVLAVLGAAYLLRAAGDAAVTALAWLSPIGWSQRTLPFAANRLWPLALPIVTGALLTWAAVALLDRRDFGAGLVATRPGPASASRALRTPLGLAWRLHRGPIVGWLIGLFLLSLTFGSLSSEIEQFFEENPAAVALLSGGAEDVVNGYLGFTTVLLSVFAGVYGVSAMLRARSEETGGRAEPVLATRTSRWRWLGSHVAVVGVGTAALLVAIGGGMGAGHAAATGDPGQMPRLIGVAFVNAPAVAVLVALAVFAFGLAPRLAAAAAWTLVGFVLFLVIFDDIVDVPEWLRQVSPYTHTPLAPVDPVTATPLVALSAVVAVLLVAGFAGLRRRDIGRS
ncbi:MAG: ABC transporter permease [Micromonosporaceae bacterium]|nr:ABC transporter permease [Micromonosporaceae bacterium]